MGYSRYDGVKYASFAASVDSAPRHRLFARASSSAPTKSGQQLNADKIEYRESRDSEANPCSTPILVGLDVTGSMGFIPEKMIKGGLGKFVGGVLQRKPVPDPHILFMGIGDACARDSAPLQATQFEADNRICDQLMDLFLEGGGGGNCFESYDLAWAFAAYRTRTDAWDKRKTKGFVFTIGDEMFPQESSKSYLEKVFANDRPQEPTPTSLLSAAQERYSVFHLIVAEGDFARRDLNRVESSWRQKLQGRALTVHNYELIPEFLVSAIALESGMELEEVLKWWDEPVAKQLCSSFQQETQ